MFNLTTIAYVFTSIPAALDEVTVLDRTLEILNEEEKRRYERFRFDADKKAFAAAHGLVRRALSRFAPVAPQDWEFETGEYGRPELNSRFAQTGLRFNLSHGRQLVACIVTKTIDCGVDVERYSRTKDPLGLAQRFFHEKEHTCLSKYEGVELDRRFVEIWALKEAYVKARGLGLHLSLSSFCYEVDETLNVTAHLDTLEREREDRWSFFLIHADENHSLGAAVLSPRIEPVEFKIEQIAL